MEMGLKIFFTDFSSNKVGRHFNVEDFEKPVKPENELTLVYKELNTLRSWREVNRNPL